MLPAIRNRSDFQNHITQTVFTSKYSFNEIVTFGLRCASFVTIHSGSIKVDYGDLSLRIAAFSGWYSTYLKQKSS